MSILFIRARSPRVPMTNTPVNIGLSRVSRLVPPFSLEYVFCSVHKLLGISRDTRDT